ncbi:MAG: excinuclease ABC subunit A [Planctomycetota bacterium]|nr:MAG: excinuclease ABC subunit A [Planctomycetota bacterium]
MSLSDVGRDAKMPWQVDGRKWHLVDRVAHNGRPCRWEGVALERVIEFLESAPEPTPVSKAIKSSDAKLASLPSKLRGKITTGAALKQQQDERGSAALLNPTARLTANWGERSVVEVVGPDASRGWFLHALTGDEWLLTLKFRVPENMFQQKSLAGALKLKPVDDIREIEAYGRSDRVRVKEVSGSWQEVTITVHWLREIDSPEFWKFLDDAKQSYLRKAGRRRKGAR